MATPLKVRTARTPRDDEAQYVIIEGAPKHYVSGFGLVGPGSIVSLAAGVTPGKWLQQVNPSDAEKASVDVEAAGRLASKAAERAADQEPERATREAAEKAAAVRTASADLAAADRVAAAQAQAQIVAGKK